MIDRLCYKDNNIHMIALDFQHTLMKGSSWE